MEFKYILVLFLYLPLASYGALNAIADYKLSKASFFVTTLRFCFWLAVLLASLFARPIVENAINRGYTQADFLTNYDVVTMFVVLVLVSLTIRFYGEIKLIRSKLYLLHQQIAIDLVDDSRGGKK